MKYEIGDLVVGQAPYVGCIVERRRDDSYRVYWFNWSDVRGNNFAFHTGRDLDFWNFK